MAIILLVVMVAAFLTFEYLHHRSKDHSNLREKKLKPVRLEKVDGVTVSYQLYFHPFHTWARRLDYQTAVIGLDDLARRLVGKADKVLLPLEGEDVSAGKPCVGVYNGKRVIRIVSPISGEVVEVNPALSKRPNLVFDDPYGDGWLYRVKSWMLKDQQQSLLNGNVIKDWMRSSVHRLRFNVREMDKELLQDGGILCENFSDKFDRHEWIRLIRENLGTEPMETD